MRLVYPLEPFLTGGDVPAGEAPAPSPLWHYNRKGTPDVAFCGYRFPPGAETESGEVWDAPAEHVCGVCHELLWQWVRERVSQ